MSGSPPPHFMCPISLEVMRDPVIVEHQGSAYWFDRVSFLRHRQSEFGDRNPLTNETNFASAPFVRDDELRTEIERSSWAPDPLEQEDTHAENITEVEPVPPVDHSAIFVLRPVETVEGVPMPWFITIQNVMRWRQGVHRARLPSVADIHRGFASFNVTS